MDNLSDLEYLQSKVGKQAIIDTHLEGIITEKVTPNAIRLRKKILNTE